MIRLHSSSRTEDLLAALAGRLESARAAGRHPLDPVEIVVPNLNVAAWIKIALAQRSGIAANLKIRRLERYVAEAVARVAPGTRILDGAAIEDLLLSVLLDEAETGARELAGIERWIHAGTSSRGAVESRRIQLARKLARVFEEYVYSRPEMLDDWIESRRPGKGSSATLLAERHLWRRIVGDGGLSGARASGLGEEWTTLDRAPAILAKADLGSIPPLSVFGVSYAGRTFHSIISGLAGVTDVDVFQISAGPPGREDEGGPAGGTIRRWGKPARESLCLLCEAAGCDPAEAGGDGGRGPATILEAVQAHAAGRPAGTFRPAPGDASVRIHECTGPRREIEVVAGEIWRLVLEDDERRPGAGDEARASRLRFNDIAVLVNPGDRDTYVPLIEAVFAEMGAIPYSLMDLPLTSASMVAEAARLIVGLPLTRFTRPDVLAILAHPAVGMDGGEARGRDWPALASRLGIFHGADHRDHAGTYIERDVASWDQGLRRLALGAFMTGERSGDLGAWESGDEAYLPLETATSEVPGVASMGLTARSLISDAIFAREASLPIREWSLLFSDMLSTHVSPGDATGARDLDRCIAAIRSMGERDLGSARLGCGTAVLLARSALDSLGWSRGQHMAGGVMVSTFQPMRSMPLAAAFVVGLGEVRFPSPDSRDQLDLRIESPARGDVSPAERDRHALMETILCARRSLSLSWTARDQATGDRIEPSSALRTILDAIGRVAGSDAAGTALVVHPLRRHAELSGPTVPHPQAVAEAHARAIGDSLRMAAGRLDAAEDPAGLRESLSPAAWTSVVEAAGTIEVPGEAAPRAAAAETPRISLFAIKSFLECPMQGSARHVLGIESEEDDEALVEEEPFEASRPTSTVMLREAFAAAARGGDREAEYDSRARRLQLEGRMPIGPLFRVARARHLATLAAWIEAIVREMGGMPGGLCSIRFGRAAEQACTGEVHDPVVVETALPDGSGGTRSARVEIHGRTGLMIGEPRSTLALVEGRGLDWSLAMRMALRAFVDHATLTASAALDPGARKSLVCGAGATRSIDIAALDRDEAREWLSAVAGQMLSGPHGFLMPCEAVFSHMKSLRAGEPSNVVDHVIEAVSNRWKGIRSDYGPVPWPRVRPIPSRDMAALLVDRLFGLPAERIPALLGRRP